MTILEAFILGIVQGLTEFLPVSSSGHMVIIERILGISSTSLVFELVMHLGTLLAVVIAYRKDVLELIKHPLSKPVRLLAVASVPTVVIVLLFQKIFRSSFDGSYLVYCFLITAILLVVSGRARTPHKKMLQKQQMGYFDAVVIGVVQGFAAFPGISRSGSTISASMLLGNDKKTSARFSFLLSIPIILGSSLVEIVTAGSMEGIAFFPLFIGFLTSFLFGVLAIKLLLRVLNGAGFDGFAVYLFFLSVFLLLNDYLLFLF